MPFFALMDYYTMLFSQITRSLLWVHRSLPDNSLIKAVIKALAGTLDDPQDPINRKRFQTLHNTELSRHILPHRPVPSNLSITIRELRWREGRHAFRISRYLGGKRHIFDITLQKSVSSLRNILVVEVTGPSWVQHNSTQFLLIRCLGSQFGIQFQERKTPGRCLRMDAPTLCFFQIRYICKSLTIS